MAGRDGPAPPATTATRAPNCAGGGRNGGRPGGGNGDAGDKAFGVVKRPAVAGSPSGRGPQGPPTEGSGGRDRPTMRALRRNMASTAASCGV